ncbi:MAG: 4-hydroxybenzoate octaprenyltransferase, partial [Mariprofundaceae bacterium]|nr:4-hydroxybenzoate octaprenyltransferase [Mariprofundaceae bacterium]
PSGLNILVFVGGVVLMRSAGCIINDYADRDFDPHVERTQQRPIAAGRISPRAALIGFFSMLLLALALVFQCSWLVIELSVVAVILAAFYPFMKRYTYFPQAWLGMAFGWGAVMAWAAETGSLMDSPIPWLLFVANICWSLSYDTAYALGDRLDDLKIGVKSTAIWFGDNAVLAIIALALCVIGLLGGVALFFTTAVQLGWLLAACYQSYLCLVLWKRGESWGFDFFLKSHRVGLLYCLGFIALSV